MKYKFKLLGGIHEDEHRRRYAKGDIIETSSNLVESFGKEKFELVHTASSESKEPAKENEEGGDETDYGDDVTEKFDQAEAKQVQVFKKGSNYTVLDGGDPLLTSDGKPLTTQKAVKDFIAELEDIDDA